MTEEYEPLPDAIIIAIPPRTAIILWALAQAEDRTIEYIASRWIQKTAAQHEHVYAEYGKSLAKAGGDFDNNTEGAERRKQRLAMTPSLRLTVMKRDGFKCVYCGGGKEKKLHVDHIVPVSRDGKTVLENLQVLCADCNIGKAAKPDLRQNVVDLIRK